MKSSVTKSDKWTKTADDALHRLKKNCLALRVFDRKINICRVKCQVVTIWIFYLLNKWDETQVMPIYEHSLKYNQTRNEHSPEFRSTSAHLLTLRR